MKKSSFESNLVDLIAKTFDKAFLDRGYRPQEHAELVVKILEDNNYIQHNRSKPLTQKLIVPEDINVKTEEKDNVVPFQTVTGGKDPSVNWLEELPQGTIFLCAPRVPKGQRNIIELEYHILFKIPGVSTKLLDNTNEERIAWVNTKNFSAAFEPVYTLGSDVE